MKMVMKMKIVMKIMVLKGSVLSLVGCKDADDDQKCDGGDVDDDEDADDYDGDIDHYEDGKLLRGDVLVFGETQ